MRHFKGFSKGGIVAIIAVVVIIAVAAYFVIDGNNKATDYSKYDFYSIIAPDEHNGNIGDHIKGDPDAPVLIFEYADYQCPGCASINPRINSLVEKLDGQLAIVYRSDILSYHQNGTAAASAAEAAGLQGYWKAYADLLFLNQAEWESATGAERTALFNQYFNQASDNEGDLEKFQADIASEAVSKKISFDQGISRRMEVPATPAFYVDGQYIDWNNKEGGSLKIGEDTFTWETTLTNEQFDDLIQKIVESKIKQQNQN